jgi:immune inhibitor A
VRRVVVGLLSAALATGVGVSLPVSAVAAPPVEPIPATPAAVAVRGADDLPNPLEEKRRELREEAVSDVISGRATTQHRGASTVVKMGRTFGSGDTGRTIAAAGADQYVELGREKTDRIFVILADFGNQRHPDFPDRDTDPLTSGPTVFDGPAHNAIPRPDRGKDTVTNWQPDHSPAWFRQLYFGTGAGVESVKTYYETQSSGRYSVDGEITDWVRVPYNEARYGRSGDDPKDAGGDDPAVCADTICPDGTWALVRDAANQWVADQKAAGRTAEQITADVKSFDRYDRYDFDHDGDFNEPDGYIDHFQIVHGGGDEADQDLYQGEDALWSHRWFAYYSDAGKTGPSGNRAGGTQVGDTGLWIGDYTMQPENGGLSVIAHEYAHDLGLPDDYDTSGRGNNNNAYWTLMAQDRLSAPGDGGFATRAGDLGAWNKLQLGWLDYETVLAGKAKTLDLGPQEYNSAKAQAVVVVLPKKQVRAPLGAPYAGSGQFYSDNKDNLDTSMTRELDLTGSSTAALSLKARYAIEKGYDYLYAEASADGGTTWTALPGTVGGTPIGTDDRGVPAIDGTTGGAWVDMAVPLDAYVGKKVLFRLHYRTDGGVSDGGFFADDITLIADEAPIFTDGAETATSAWKLTGFTVRGASIVTAEYDNYYIAGNRSHVSYDRYLRTGPFFYGYADTRPKFVEHYPYQQGLLVSYWDTSQNDNNTNVHPGAGRNLFVDAHPDAFYDLQGQPWRVAVQMYDAPFGLAKADSFTLHVNGKPNYVWGQAAEPTFDDTRQTFFPDLPANGVKLPAVGVKIQVVEQNGTSMKIKIS